MNIDDIDRESHCNRIYSSLTFYHLIVWKKQPVALEVYCLKYWSKKLQKSMDRCTRYRNVLEIMLNAASNIQIGKL